MKLTDAEYRNETIKRFKADVTNQLSPLHNKVHFPANYEKVDLKKTVPAINASSIMEGTNHTTVKAIEPPAHGWNYCQYEPESVPTAMVTISKEAFLSEV